MSLSRQAIERIEELTTSANHLTLDSEIPLVSLPGGNTLHSLERYMESPARFRGSFLTGSLEDFLDYVGRHEELDAAVYVSPEAMSAAAILDQGDSCAPGWGEHTARLEMVPSPASKALLKFTQAPHNQQEMIDFIEDWAPAITMLEQYGGDEEIPTLEAINTIRRIDTKAVREVGQVQGDFNQGRSALEQIEVNSRGRSLPGGLIFTCAPYPELAERTFRCRIYARTGADEVSLGCRIVGMEEQRELISKELVSLIIESEKSSVPVLRGVMQYQKS